MNYNMNSILTDWAFRVICMSLCFYFLKMQSLEDQLKKLVYVVDAVCADVQRGQRIYNKLFDR